ncbi:DNA-packaging protein [bacterium AH-315-P15]|nr:DNA-packaging protein [bacterium AH-315-P15]
MRAAFLTSLKAEEIDYLLHHWPFWARQDQLPPECDWTTWLVLGGRGAGKTRTGAEWVRAQVEGPTPLSTGAACRLALVAQDYGEARSVMVEGPSGILALTPAAWRPAWRKTARELVWPNGAKATLFSAEDPEALRGPQHDAAWLDEFAKYTYAEETWDMLQFGLRLGPRPRQVVTTTPRPLAALKRLMADKNTVTTRASTFENRANLAHAFFDAVVARYEGTHLGRQELDGELIDEIAGALWSRGMIEHSRLSEAPALTRIVVGVDPPVSSGPRADECGLVIAGVDKSGRGYVLADRTVQGLGPAAWAARAVNLMVEFEADRLVAEVNQGGELVRSVLEQIDPNVSLRMVRASRGKILRAEPIAALYERGRVAHVGVHSELEDQMCSFTGGPLTGGPFTRGMGHSSPDRLDALVWALTELMLTGEAGEPRIRAFQS